MNGSFEALVAEAQAAPIDGWDFSWLDGRASEERPSWRYCRAGRGADRERREDARPRVAVAARCWRACRSFPPAWSRPRAYAPNVTVAARRLRPRGAFVVACAGRSVRRCRSRSETFDLVTSRHPVTTWWEEIACVLRPGGTYFSQQVGPNSVRELSEFMMGPLPPGTQRDPDSRAPARGGGRAHRVGSSVRAAADDLRRHRGGRVLPPSGDLDRARLHGRAVTSTGCARCTSRSRPKARTSCTRAGS